MPQQPFNPVTLRLLVAETLKAINLYSEAATELELMTCAVESLFGQHRRQVGGGPALGVMQVEPTTHNWLVRDFLRAVERRKPGLTLAISKFTKDWEAEELVDNDEYSICVARLKYLSIPKPLPPPWDVLGMAAYWKKYYNAAGPRGCPASDAVKKYSYYVLDAQTPQPKKLKAKPPTDSEPAEAPQTDG